MKSVISTLLLGVLGYAGAAPLPAAPPATVVVATGGGNVVGRFVTAFSPYLAPAPAVLVPFQTEFVQFTLEINPFTAAGVGRNGFRFPIGAEVFYEAGCARPSHISRTLDDSGTTLVGTVKHIAPIGAAPASILGVIAKNEIVTRPMSSLYRLNSGYCQQLGGAEVRELHPVIGTVALPTVPLFIK